jgi:hypothetical protein
MTLGDWLNSLINVVLGMFLGMAALGLANLIGAGLWVPAILFTVPVVLLMFFDQGLGHLIDRLFPSGIRPARVPAPPRGKPLVRTLSLPAGVVLGVLVAALGLSDGLLPAL